MARGIPNLKSQALFLLAQNGSPQSREVLARIAKGQSNPDLQRKAVEYLGMSVDRSLGKHLRQSMHPRATSR